MAPVVGTGRGSPRTAPSTSASNSNNFLLVSNYVPRHQPASSRLARCAAQGASGPQRLHLQPDSGALDSCEPTTSQPFAPAITRRRAIAGLAAAAPLLGVAFGAVTALPAHASKLPPIADSAWEALGGGPADLYFPEAFLGEWLVTSVLVNLETPLGTEYVPNLQAVERARRDDLNQGMRYGVAFMRQGDKVIYDRRYNTAAMMAAYYGQSINFSNRIDWNPSDPNVLRLSMPGGLAIRTRVTRRSEAYPEPSRIETSEYVEQIFDDPGAAAPRVKASQCFTKYKFRSEAAAAADNGPVVVATQVVSDYLTPYDGEELYFKAMNRPVAQYTYKMAFVRLPKSVAAL